MQAFLVHCLTRTPRKKPECPRPSNLAVISFLITTKYLLSYPFWIHNFEFFFLKKVSKLCKFQDPRNLDPSLTNYCQCALSKMQICLCQWPTRNPSKLFLVWPLLSLSASLACRFPPFCWPGLTAGELNSSSSNFPNVFSDPPDRVRLLWALCITPCLPQSWQ